MRKKIIILIIFFICIPTKNNSVSKEEILKDLAKPEFRKNWMRNELIAQLLQKPPFTQEEILIIQNFREHLKDRIKDKEIRIQPYRKKTFTEYLLESLQQMFLPKRHMTELEGYSLLLTYCFFPISFPTAINNAIITYETDEREEKEDLEWYQSLLKKDKEFLKNINDALEETSPQNPAIQHHQAAS